MKKILFILIAITAMALSSKFVSSDEDIERGRQVYELDRLKTQPTYQVCEILENPNHWKAVTLKRHLEKEDRDSTLVVNFSKVYTPSAEKLKVNDRLKVIFTEEIGRNFSPKYKAEQCYLARNFVFLKKIPQLEKLADERKK